jgi:hypothetical protein
MSQVDQTSTIFHPKHNINIQYIHYIHITLYTSSYTSSSFLSDLTVQSLKEKNRKL